MHRQPPSRDALIESHLPLARALAFRYRHSAEPLEDLVQVAAVGLVKAADRWDPGRGSAFSSFAVPTILGELRRHFRDATWDVRPPRRLQEVCMSLERAWSTLLSRTGREPTVAELAAHLGLSAQETAEGLRAMEGRRLPSLDAAAHDGDDDAIAIGHAIGFEEAGYAQIEAQDAFDSLVAGFDKRARTMLRLRFEDDLRQWEISARVGCSQMHVSRIIRSALERLASSPQLRVAA
jgi:RNA polymerase sigma-B factor